MALLGRGVLAIWNGIAQGSEADFLAWHVREHIPERVCLPGFLRGRRYVAVDGQPQYFNFYETDTTAALTSSAYRARLDAPTEWTRRVVSRFEATSRTVCDVAASLGHGSGGYVETLRLQALDGVEKFPAGVVEGLLPRIAEQPGIVAIHLLHGQPDASASVGNSAEKTLKAAPDETVDWVILVEAVEADFLLALRQGLIGRDALVRHGFAPAIERGLYRLQFGLSQEDLEADAVA